MPRPSKGQHRWAGIVFGLVFVMLHGPDNHPIWVAPSQVVSVQPFNDERPEVHTWVRTLNGDIYVRERAEAVIRELSK